MLLRCLPARATSTLSSRSFWVTAWRPERTAQRAASFTTLARSAPLAPGVIRAMAARSISPSVLIRLQCIRRIASRPP